MSAETQKVDVVGYAERAYFLIKSAGIFGKLGEFDINGKDAFFEAAELVGEGEDVIPAMVELIKASNRTILAFEAYGKANGLVTELRARQECEAAMVAQKEALARIGGAE